MSHGPGYGEHPEHSLLMRPLPVRVKITLKGKRIADSEHVIVVEEHGRDPVYYLPREDVAMDQLERSAKHTHCPFKGEASYFDARTEGGVVEEIAWTYEEPYNETRSIGGYVAFAPERVDSFDVSPRFDHSMGGAQASG